MRNFIKKEIPELKTEFIIKNTCIYINIQKLTTDNDLKLFKDLVLQFKNTNDREKK